ncbi:pyrimidine dimer DNA glycosylase/endonuclease V [Candidatus Tisiphia endosymbiont of Beris chalybata]|uniref:pyrimidine dimer DNA glycosylase/endonuclease V n=1 Tax=Candidatus Tisiphia endosymbiont of Beris chalybata TaxID=3066262 RepID=UPI00312CB182
MNIFVTNLSPIISAQVLDDKRVIKMVLESAQLLSTAIFLNSSIIYPNIYKPTHINHMCTIWAATNYSNWFWLFNHLIALCSEYSLRYHKKHKTEELVSHLLTYSTHLKQGENITAFPNCTKSIQLPLNSIPNQNIYEAYQQYLNAKWLHDKTPPKWTRRAPPFWAHPTFLTI